MFDAVSHSDREKRIPAHIEKSYMVPSYFIQLDHMPLTPNGKIDRNSLKTIDVTGEPLMERQPSRKNIQDTVLAIWQEVLKTSDIEWEDGFTICQ